MTRCMVLLPSALFPLQYPCWSVPLEPAKPCQPPLQMAFAEAFGHSPSFDPPRTGQASKLRDWHLSAPVSPRIPAAPTPALLHSASSTSSTASDCGSPSGPRFLVPGFEDPVSLAPKVSLHSGCASLAAGDTVAAAGACRANQQAAFSGQADSLPPQGELSSNASQRLHAAGSRSHEVASAEPSKLVPGTLKCFQP